MNPNALLAGAAAIDITPDRNLDLAGGAFGPAKGLLHPLQAKALLLKSGNLQCLVIACDLLGLDADYASAVGQRIADRLQMSADAILLACTHTHCAPATMTLRNWGSKDPQYMASLADRLVQVAQTAGDNLSPARLSAGSIACPGLSTNRCAGPGGPIDDTLALLHVADPAGRPLAVVINYAVHAVNLHNSLLYTPDFPYYLEQDLRSALDTQVPVLFLAGPSGDLLPANFKAQTPSEPAARQTAAGLCAKTLELLSGLAPAADQSLAYARCTAQLPLAELPPRDQLLAIRDDNARALESITDRSPTNWTYAKHKTYVEWADEALAALDSGVRRTQPVDLHALRVGPALVLGVPGELFCEFGLAIRQSNPAPLLLATLTNGAWGYFPSRLAFEKKTYEAAHCPRYLGTYFYTESVAETLQNAAIKLLADL